MKFLKIASIFLIGLFIMIAVNETIAFGKLISGDNLYVEYGFYVFILALIVAYVVYPIVRYTSRPSVELLRKAALGDLKGIRRFRKNVFKGLSIEEQEVLTAISLEDVEGNVTWIKDYVKKRTIENVQLIRTSALQLTTVVIVSPNSFIDGLAVLFGNSQMIYAISRNMGVRYRWADIYNMYFGSLAMSSVTGLLQEFQDEIEEGVEEIFENVADEFSEFFSEESAKQASDAVPIISIFTKVMVPILQAASNYAFIVYNGYRFNETILAQLEDHPMDQQAINRSARKKARRDKYKYVLELSSKVGYSGKNMVKGWFKKKDKGLDSL